MPRTYNVAVKHTGSANNARLQTINQPIKRRRACAETGANGRLTGAGRREDRERIAESVTGFGLPHSTTVSAVSVNPLWTDRV